MKQTIEKIDKILRMGGMFNPEPLENHKIYDLLQECRNNLEKMQNLLEKQQEVIRRVYVDQFPNTWFPAGGFGEKDNNGLPQFIEIVPSYGVDWSQVYEKTDRTINYWGS